MQTMHTAICCPLSPADVLEHVIILADPWVKVQAGELHWESAGVGHNHTSLIGSLRGHQHQHKHKHKCSLCTLVCIFVPSSRGCKFVPSSRVCDIQSRMIATPWCGSYHAQRLLHDAALSLGVRASSIAPSQGGAGLQRKCAECCICHFWYSARTFLYTKTFTLTMHEHVHTVYALAGSTQRGKHILLNT